MNNHRYGMKLSAMNNTHITNTSMTYNSLDGMHLEIMSITHITNMTAAQNRWSGMCLSANNMTHLTKATVIQNGKPLNSYVGLFDKQILIISSKATLIYNTSFTDVFVQGSSSTDNPIPVYLQLLCSISQQYISVDVFLQKTTYLP